MVGHSSGRLAIDRCFLYYGDAGRGKSPPKRAKKVGLVAADKNTKGVPASQVGGGGR